MLWWYFEQSFYRYWGGASEMSHAWPGMGLWTADDDYVCEGKRGPDIGQGRVIEVWTLNHRVAAAQQEGNVYTVTVEPTEAGYQVVHLPGPGISFPKATIHFVESQGREIDHLPKVPPWQAIPAPWHTVTITGSVIDNVRSAEVVTLEDAEGERWYIPWMDTIIVQWSDGTPAQFRDIDRGMTIEVAGFRRTEAVSPNTVSAVRVTILDGK